MTTGYSGRPLPEKLGFRQGQRVAIVDAPRGWVDTHLSDLPFVEMRTLRSRQLDLIVLFAPNRAALRLRFDRAMASLAADGALWVAWPKRSSGVPTDLTEDVVRAVALPTGLVDNKVAALDETWSGLRLVVRVENRPAWGSHH